VVLGTEAGELAIVTVFVARHNGLRSAANRKRRRNTAQEVQEFQEGSEETSSRQGTTDSHLSQPAERLKLRRWIGTARWTYNRCLIAVEKEGIKREKKDLRALCLNAKNFNDTKLKWVLETPYDIRDEAMNDLLKGYSSNFAAKGKKFKMKFRSKKDSQQSITILSKHWGKSRGEYSFLPNIKSSEPLPRKLEYDSRLVMNRLGEYYLCIPRPLEIRAENQSPKVFIYCLSLYNIY